MRTEHHYWHSPRLGHDMGMAVFGQRDGVVLAECGRKPEAIDSWKVAKPSRS